jgi:energy-coupling factor transport system permease protein
MMVQIYQEGDTVLHRVNPTVKLSALLLLTLVPTFFLDPQVPAAFLLLALVMGWVLGGVSPRRLARTLAPVLAIALAMAISSTLFYGGARSHVLVSLGPLRIYTEGLAFGLSIGLRVLCVASFSAIFMFTTDPTRLVYSLIQQARMSYRLGYTIMAAFRFMLIMQREMANISAAHAVRGAYSVRSPSAALERARRYGVPLLANSIRQAERLAVAMDARGFASGWQRTYYMTVPVTVLDGFFLACTLVVTAAILMALAYFGLLRGFLVGLSSSLFGGGGSP